MCSWTEVEAQPELSIRPHSGQRLTCCGWNLQKQGCLFAVFGDISQSSHITNLAAERREKEADKKRSSDILVLPGYAPSKL